MGEAFPECTSCGKSLYLPWNQPIRWDFGRPVCAECIRKDC